MSDIAKEFNIGNSTLKKIFSTKWDRNFSQKK